VIVEVQTALAIYLYGFTLPGSVAPPILGVDDQHALSIHQCAGLNAVISSVVLGDFTGEIGENNVQNIAWLTPRACRMRRSSTDWWNKVRFILYRSVHCFPI